MSHVKLLFPDKREFDLNAGAGETASFLQSELAPHFIVNALIRLPVMIQRNPENAVAFTKSLTSVYRDILEAGNKDLVPLAKELELLNNYINLVKIDFKRSINIQCDSRPYRNFFIVPVSLQILMENAVKHNNFSCEYPLNIKIYRDEKFIWFNNPIRRKKYPAFSGKRGLPNLDARCRIITGHPIQIKESATDFTVRLPLIYMPDA